MNFIDIRNNNLNKLSELGFRVASSLPVSSGSDLRGYKEIASRLYALDAVVCWVVFSEEQTSSDRIKSYVEKNQLNEYMTQEELGIISLPRAEANEQYLNTIGWRLENMWALSWVLGFDIEPLVNIGQLPNEVTKAMIYEFMPGLDSVVDDLLASDKARSLEEIIALEDLYYCAHNAVRSAQLGGATVPENYDPVSDGGAVHERRHSLTWCLSPNENWEETDLST
ncbi:DUF4272 domain-containing protein [Bacterioplanoides sp.]|uniref:DUF4272 domain-containing protein n=1 Tax=Bacterioplanoides sp. TaxID=2066072 RepID=UPI003B00E756